MLNKNFYLKKINFSGNIDSMEDLKVSKYVHYLQVDKEIFIGWNRFFPSIFILNKAALELLDRIEKKTPIESNETISRFLKEAQKHKFLYDGEIDPSMEDFFTTAHRKLEEQDERAKDFYRKEEDYGALKIINEVCNLSCFYCVNKIETEDDSSKSRCGGDKKMSLQQKMQIIDKCVDQFFYRKIKKGVSQTKIFFSGGEILADWPLVKKIVERISKNYPGIEVEYGMNTNLTLLTEEIAIFLNEHNFIVDISIDGYKEAHNRTRIYHNGKGSFDDIIKKVELYRKFNKEKSMVYFQGTIEYPDDFHPEEVYKMDRYGFIGARLAPNLLIGSEEDARKKAQLMGRFLELNSPGGFEVTELIFTKAKDKINQEEFQFSLNCHGLSVFPKPEIEINITTLSVSQICGFIKQAALPIEDIQYDIYNPKLWDISYGFIKNRMETVLRDCLECPLLGICLGGCILSGIDQGNRINKAACAYQKEIWEIYLKKVYQDRKKKKS
jgi:radical SAM protein with 4Fe4S-binding SPASM domain